jgi:wobble nucleotide-excising tRNase
VIYGENGRGKTTLAAILRSLKDGNPVFIAERHRLRATHPPHVVIDCQGGPAVFEDDAWNLTLGDLVIFDDSFVNANVYSGLVVEPGHRQGLHELILGAEGVALNEALQQHASSVEEHNKELRRKAEVIPEVVRGPFTVDAFCALTARSDIDADILAAERNLAAVTEAERVQRMPPLEALRLPRFDCDGLAALLGRDLPEIDATALKELQDHIRTIGEGGEAWLEDGMRRLSTGSGEAPKSQACPFCGQSVAASPILAHYRAYFGDEYAALKRDVENAISKVNAEHGPDAIAAFERAAQTNLERATFWAQFCNLPDFNLETSDSLKAWAAAREALLGVLEAKRNAPLDRLALPANLKETVSVFNELERKVVTVNENVRTAAQEIALVKERASAGDRAALVSDIARLKAIRIRFTADVVSASDAYIAEKADKATTEKARDDARAALDSYRRTVFPAYETAINLYLQRFNAGFRVGSVTSTNTRSGSSCTYNVVINSEPVPIGGPEQAGNPSFRNTLSAGDRSTLALAFFFASLDQDPNLRERLVIMDDPITSLDEHRQLNTVQEVRRIAGRAKQVVVLSHDKAFACGVWEGAKRDARGALEVVRSGDASIIQGWDVTRELTTVHDRRHELFSKFLEAAGSVDGRDVAIALRPHLEAFLRVAYPAQFPPGTLLGPFLNLCEQRLGTPEQLLDVADTSELGNIIEYANKFHHDTNPAWASESINDTELLGFVQRTLRFTSRR